MPGGLPVGAGADEHWAQNQRNVLYCLESVVLTVSAEAFVLSMATNAIKRCEGYIVAIGLLD